MDRGDSTIRQMYGISVEEYEQCCELGENSKWDDSVPTCTILNGQLIINPQWWLKLNMDQRVAAIRHENMHYRAFYQKECECGKDKHGFMFHSTWCPKWSR